MTTDKTPATLATAKHGGCVQLKDFPSPGGQGALASLPLYRLADDANGNRGLHRDDTGSWVKLQDVERALAARQPIQSVSADEAPFGMTTAEKTAWARGANDAIEEYAARQPVGEPVAWLLISEAGTAIGATRHARERESWEAAGGTTEPLYATPRVQDVDGYQAAFYELADMLGIPAQPCSPKVVWEAQMRPALQAAITAQGPVPMVLHCPRCHVQHIDAPDERTPGWQNPPHRSHLCHGCGLIWRPADVPTIGVECTQTVGRGDTPFVPPLSTRPVACLLFDRNGVLRRTRPFTTDGQYVFDAGTLARLNEGNPQLAPFKAKLVYASPTTNPADLSEYRDAVMHAYGIVEPDEYCEKLGELLDLIDSQAVGKPVARLIEAIEGECSGLAINNETAAAILAHVFPLGHAPAAYMVDGRLEQGLFFDKAAAENMAAMNAGDVVPLFRPTAQAVDLSEFRDAVQYAHDMGSESKRQDRARLLALIDGKAAGNG